jgi:hypothetical protein
MLAMLKTGMKVFAGIMVVGVIALVGLYLGGNADDSPEMIDGVPVLKFRDGGTPPPSLQGGATVVDYAVAHADTISPTNLLGAAGTAYHIGRLEDAAFLFYAGRIRARYDLQRYEPKGTGGDSPGVFFQALIQAESTPIIQDLCVNATAFTNVLDRMDAWKIKESPGYDPGYAHTLENVPADLGEQLTKQSLDGTRPLAKLLTIPEYVQALKSLQAINRSADSLDPSAETLERRAKAEAALQRIEKQQNVKGIMTAKSEAE